MQKTEIICDRCGKEIENPYKCYKSNYMVKDSSAKIQLWGVGEYRGAPGQRIDLCADCYQKFIDFLEGDNNAEE